MTANDLPHVAVVQRAIPHYRGPFFRALRTRLHDAGVRLRVIHSDRPASLGGGPGKADLDWIDERPGKRWEIGDHTIAWQPVLRATRSARLVVVEQATHLPVNYLLLARQMLGGPPVAFWGHGRNFLVDEDEHSLSEWVKSISSRRAHWWFAYNDLAARAVADMGFPRERITSVLNSTDTRRLAHQIDRLSADDVSAVRRELDLSGTNVGLFVGRLGPVKHLDHLFAAADLVHRRVPDFELVVVGDGTERPAVTAWTRDRSWARYAGARFGAALAPLLATAKLTLLPAWAGLVITDSFAARVPIVASAAFAHPPEIAYVRDGYNGLLVDDGGDPALYAEAVAGLLEDEQRRASLVRGCEVSRGDYSIERMAERFTEGVLRALTAPPRGLGHGRRR